MRGLHGDHALCHSHRAASISQHAYKRHNNLLLASNLTDVQVHNHKSDPSLEKGQVAVFLIPIFMESSAPHMDSSGRRVYDKKSIDWHREQRHPAHRLAASLNLGMLTYASDQSTVKIEKETLEKVTAE